MNLAVSLRVMGGLEAATGLLLVLAPQFLVVLLLGQPPESTLALLLARFAGMVLLCLGIVCYGAGADAAGRAARAAAFGLLLYDVLIVLWLIWAAVSGLAGVALWPVVVAHALLAGWCVAGLRRAGAGT